MNDIYINKPSSFGDYQLFDPKSTPIVEHNVNETPNTVLTSSDTINDTSIITGGTATIQIIETDLGLTTCAINIPSWPTIIIAVIGAVVVMYTAIAPNVESNRRVFGVIFLTLWTIIWALILWVLWRECHRIAAWWLLLIPVTLMALFFILIIVMNIGSSI